MIDLQIVLVVLQLLVIDL